MEIFDLTNDVKTFGCQVKTFPMGIGESFDALMKIIPEKKERAYYGVSHSAEDGSIIYYTLAEEVFDGEAKKYGDYTYTIEKGKYLTIRLKDWMKNTDCIKDLFEEIMKDDRADLNMPCVEWYMKKDEMLCMMRMKTGADGFDVRHETLEVNREK
jgi:hypothetical protein